MARNDAQVKVAIAAEDQAAAVIRNVEREFATFAQSVQGLGSVMSTVGLGLGAGSLVGMAAAIGELTNKAAEMEAGIFRAMKQTALSAETLSALRVASEQTGESFESLSTSLARLGKNIAEGLDSPSSKAAKILQALFTTAERESMKLMTVDEREQAVIRRIYQLNDANDRQLALATMVGRGWMSNAETFERVANEGLTPLIEKAKELGQYVSPEQAMHAHEYEEAWNGIKLAFTGTARSLVDELIPALAHLAEAYMLKPSALNIFEQRLQEYSDTLAKLREERKKETNEYRQSTLDDEIKRYEKLIEVTNTWLNKQAAAGVQFQKQQHKTGAPPHKNLGDVLGGEGKAKPLISESDLSAANKFEEAQTRILAGLIKESDTFGMTAGEIKLYELALAGADAAELAFARRLVDGVEAKQKAHKATLDLEKETEAYNAELEQYAIAIYEKLQTPTEKAEAEMDKLSEAFRAGYIDVETYHRGLQQIQDDLDLTRLKTEENTDSTDTMRSSVRQIGSEMSSGFAQMIVYGRGFGSMLEGLLERLIQLVLQALVFKQIAQSLEGESGWKGILGSLFGGAAGPFAGGFAEGGNIPAGSFGLVGENGPELLPGPATVMPLKGLGVTVHNSFVIDARGNPDPGRDLRLRQMLRETHRAAVKDAVTVMHERARRAG